MEHIGSTIADTATVGVQLSADNPRESALQQMCPTLGSLLNFYMTSHVTLHLGQLSAWRRMEGFWEHTIEDEDDLEAHFDYIHWNPRKHRLVARVHDWPWSTFHKHVRLGHYDMGWGGTEPRNFTTIESFGEPGEW